MCDMTVSHADLGDELGTVMATCEQSRVCRSVPIEQTVPALSITHMYLMNVPDFSSLACRHHKSSLYNIPRRKAHELLSHLNT